MVICSAMHAVSMKTNVISIEEISSFSLDHLEKMKITNYPIKKSKFQFEVRPLHRVVPDSVNFTIKDSLLYNAD